MDAGPVLSQKSVAVSENASAGEVLPHLFEIGTELLLESLPAVFEGEVSAETAEVQSEDDVLAADLISGEEGELKVWKEGARVCHDRVRGFSMWPGTRYSDVMQS